MLSEEQLKAMEVNAPLVVAELRETRFERDKLAEACEVFKLGIEHLEHELNHVRQLAQAAVEHLEVAGKAQPFCPKCFSPLKRGPVGSGRFDWLPCKCEAERFT
jgi:hypothetical protein